MMLSTRILGSKDLFAEIKADILSLKDKIDIIGQECVEKVRDELAKSGKTKQTVKYKKLIKGNSLSLRIIIYEEENKVEAEETVEVGKDNIPIVVLNEAAEFDNTGKRVVSSKRLIQRILNDVIYKYV